MNKVILYWNHICILQHEENRQLNLVKERLVKHNIDLDIKHFGLGHPLHMSEYLAQKDALLPDIIVSADLEVFEDKRLYNKLLPLHNTLNWLPLKNNEMIKACVRQETLTPFIIIPLVCYTTNLNKYNNTSILDHCDSSFSIGGINNSAVKSIYKSVYQKFGKDNANRLIKEASVAPIPINAFQNVRTGVTDGCLVPKLYTFSADNINTFEVEFTEGIYLLPSYFTARKTVDESIAKIVQIEIMNEAFLNMYAKSGKLITCPKIDTTNLEDNYTKFQVISKDFINSFDNKAFYDDYTSILSTAKNLFE